LWQVGFIDMIVLPLLENWVSVFPQCEPLLEQVGYTATSPRSRRLIGCWIWTALGCVLLARVPQLKAVIWYRHGPTGTTGRLRAIETSFKIQTSFERYTVGMQSSGKVPSSKRKQPSATVS